VDLPGKIVYYLLTQQNQHHFGQAHRTPLTTHTFTQSSNWTAELILSGNYDTSELSDIQASLLQHCQSQQLDTPISKFQSWNKGTSTFPLGLHLGHYKGLVLCNDVDTTTEEGQALESKQKTLI
jgi:hypothetical protein